MQRSIVAALANTTTLDDIVEKSADLKEQSGIFKKSAQSLKAKMRCKNIKVNVKQHTSLVPCSYCPCPSKICPQTWCMVFWVLAIVIIIIALVVAAQAGAFKKM